MVLTRRERKALSSITRLPNELLIQVIDDVPVIDLPSLCRVSKLLHGLTLPFLNRDVVLFVDCCSFITFCSSLVANPTRGSAIRSFALRQWFSFTDYQPASENELGLVVKAMQTMSRLEKLDLSITALYPKLNLLTFPQLLSCKLSNNETHSSYYAAAEQFLRRHETITTLSMRLGYEPLVPIPMITLPNVKHLEAPSHVLKHVVSQNISATRVFWSDRSDMPSETLIEETVSMLKGLTNPRAPFICYQHLGGMRRTDCVPVLVSLSRHMQHTTSLCVRAKDMITMNNLVSRLPPFSKLEYLALDCSQPTPKGRAKAWELVSKQVGVGILGALIACRIHHTAWKKVDGLRVEYPEAEFQIQAGFAAFAVHG